METPNKFDILIDPANTVFAVNCRVEGSTLHCGALYVEPSIPFHLIRLAHNSASIDIELPDELRNLLAPAKAWEVALQIHDEQVRQPSVLS
jgi:hypothetical protein